MWRESPREREMRAAFIAQTEDILRRRDSFRKSEKTWTVGLESELGLWREGWNEAEIWNARSDVIADHDDLCDIELGACQCELRTSPISLVSGTSRFLAEYAEKTDRLVSAMHARGLSVLRVGANPFVRLRDPMRSPEKEKYRAVPDFNNLHRRKGVRPSISFGGVRIPLDASAISAFQAFHVNLEAISLEDAVNMANRSLWLSPYLLACSGNSRFVRGDRTISDSGMNDLRYRVWQLGHDTRTDEDLRRRWSWRGGLPERYMESAEDYFRRIIRHPFILHDPEHALQIGIGLAWLDARIKFIDEAAIVELRSIPTQVSVEDDAALTFFYLGRLNFSMVHERQLLPMRFLRENRTEAMVRGMSGRYWCSPAIPGRTRWVNLPAQEMFALELARAMQGLQHIGIMSPGISQSLESWSTKVLHDGSPSDRLAKILRGSLRVEDDEMARALRRTGMILSPS